MSDHFERLGLPRRFSVDTAELERNYLDRSRLTHPDRHQSGSALELAASLQTAADLNDAYRILRDPFLRADYLLNEVGAPSAGAVRDLPPEFLEEMLELRMEIGELTPETPEANAMEERLRIRRDAMLGEIGRGIDETADLTGTAGVAVRRNLNAVKYVANLIRDLRSLE